MQRHGVGGAAGEVGMMLEFETRRKVGLRLACWMQRRLRRLARIMRGR